MKPGTPAFPINEPSKELKEILLKLGSLNHRHESLQVEVDEILVSKYLKNSKKAIQLYISIEIE